MNIQFLQHEYTWSDHCITGNKLGWGITSSSIPKAEDMLRELEKLAALSEADRTGGEPVEELVYSRDTGFVLMRTIPVDQGEDGRQNKLVYMIQPSDIATVDPAVYFAGIGRGAAGQPDMIMEDRQTADSDHDARLPLLLLPVLKEDPDKVLSFYQLSEKLPLLLKAVFWNLLEYPGSLNFVAPDWNRTDFSYHAGRLMYAVHQMLPAALRIRAGYRSYAREEIPGTAFYFTEEARGKACFELGKDYQENRDPEEDELSALFFEGLASCWKKDRERYYSIMERINDYLENRSDSIMDLKKIQWIFFDIEAEKGGYSLSFDYILSNLPQLIYWGSGDDYFAGITGRCQALIHEHTPTAVQTEAYRQALLDGVSKRSLKPICQEFIWLLSKKSKEEDGDAEQLLGRIRESNPAVYKALTVSLAEEEGWEPVLKRMEEQTAADRTEEHLPCGLSPENGGIDDRSPDMERKGEDMEEAGLSAQNKVLKQDAPEASDQTAEGQEARYRVLNEDGEEKTKSSGGDFLMTVLPTGFLTGCVMFLSHYSLMIGHWKIAVGMAGMWIILMLNFACLFKRSQQKRPLWMGIGLCLLVGELIELAAYYFVIQRYRLLFFIVLGAIAVIISVISIIRSYTDRQ